MEAASFTASASWAADTVTVWAVSQLDGLKVSVARSTVTSGLPLMVTPITTLEVGCVFRTHRVGCELPPSATVSVVSDTAHRADGHGVVVGDGHRNPEPMVTASYSLALWAATTAWVMDGCVVHRVGVLGRPHRHRLGRVPVGRAEGQRGPVDTVTSGLPLMVTPITTLPDGSASRTTV